VARARFLALSDDPELRFRTPGAYRAALALDTDRRLLWGELAEVYAELSMHEEAAGAYREVLALDDSNAIDHMNLGFSLARQGLFEQGAAAYDRALELDPEQGWAYYYRSECRINLDRQAEALADLEAAIARLPGQIVPLLAAVKLNSERGQHDVADAYLEQAVALQPRNAEVGLAQAKSLLRQQRAEEALPILEALVAGVPQMIDARYQLGQALMRLGRTDEGRQVLADYQQLLQRQTADQQGADREQVADRVRVHVMRGEVFLGEERLDDARGQFEAAAELAPEDAEVLRALLRCLETIGDEPAAAAIRDRIAALG
jgi:tetratricopeptide (TPR) repeat protein